MMANEELAVKLMETEARSRSNTKRLDTMEKRQDNLDRLINTVTVLANEQEHIKTDVREVKTDVKRLVESPGKRWNSIVDKVLLVVIGAMVAFLLARVGL